MPREPKASQGFPLGMLFFFYLFLTILTILTAFYDLPNSHFLKKGLMRRMLEVMMLKPIMTRPKTTDSTTSMTKLWG